jgi:iron complex outermembrane receptor protein
MTIRKALKRGTLILAHTVAAILIAAQEPPVARAAEPAVLDRLIRFDIPAQALASALMQFSAQSGLDLSAATDVVEGKRASELKGTYSTAQALHALLRGTGLRFIAAEGVVTIRPAEDAAAAAPPTKQAMLLAQTPEASGEQLEEIVVSVFGRSRGETLREIPQSVRVFDASFLGDVGATDLYNVLRFVPSSANRRSQMGYNPQEFNIRGFDSMQTLNGTSINTLNHSLDLQNVERVEVLMGPASVLYGAMEPGAVINLVTKQPLDHHHWEFGTEFGSYDSYRFTADVGGPLSQRVGARLNVAYQDRESFLDHWSADKLFVAPVISFELSDRTRLTTEAVYSRDRAPAGPYVGYPAAGMLTSNPHGRYRRSFFIADPERDEGVGLDRKAARLEARLTHAFSDRLSARAAVSYTYGRADEGDMLAAGFENDDFRTLRRFFFIGRNSKRDDLSYYLDLSGEFRAGPLTHQLSVGAEHLSLRGDNTAGRGGYFATPVDLFTPVYGSTLRNPLLLNGSKIDTSTIGVFLQDRIAVGERLDLIAGIRYAEIETSNLFIPAGAAPDPQERSEQSDWPSLLGLLYEVTDSVSLFANRSKSFLPREGTTQGGRPFPPERSVQYELGTKFELGRSGLSGSIALFEIEKPDVLTPDLANPGFEVPLGEVTSRGAELSLQGQLSSSWFVYASYGYLDTEVASADPELDGNELRLAPGSTFSLMTRYDFSGGRLAGLGISGSAHRVGTRFINDGNSLLLPSYTRIDLGVHFEATERLALSFLVNNLTDEDVYSGFSPAEMEIDLPRNFLAKMILRM